VGTCELELSVDREETGLITVGLTTVASTIVCAKQGKAKKTVVVQIDINPISFTVIGKGLGVIDLIWIGI
jgi:hypothetical protein